MTMFSRILKGWTRFAHALGAVNTYVLLSIFFVLVITPMGFLFRLFGKGIVNKRPAGSSWMASADDNDMEKPF